MNNRILFIIGNGFDLAHGLHSKYSDFAKYCKSTEYYKNLYELLPLEFPKLSINSSTNSPTDSSELWANFEEALGAPDIEYIKNHRNVDKGELNVALRDWVNDLKDKINEIQPMDCIKKTIQTYPKAYYISFNYTDTLELLYKVKSMNILHIHGYVSRNDVDASEAFAGYLYGHNLNDEEISKMFNAVSDENYNICNIIEHIRHFRKPVDVAHAPDRALEAFLQPLSIDNIVVVGHSLGVMDQDYFKKINESFPKAKWHISYHENNQCISSVERIGLNPSHVSYFIF